MANREPFAPDEWYHCYSRGVDRRAVFQARGDYERFLQLLYLLNSSKTIHRSDLSKVTTADVVQKKRGDPLVAIGAYCLMPNHFHLLLKERVADGIPKFMRALGISYAMYFNIKNDRSGNLFVRPFRSKHVDDDRYFRRVAQYIHLNPAALYEAGWSEGKIKNERTLADHVNAYRYSSLPDYLKPHRRPEGVIIDKEAFDLLRGHLPPIRELLAEAAEYHAVLSR